MMRRPRRFVLKSGVFSEEVEHRATVNHLRVKYPGALFTIAPSGMRLPMSVAQRFKAMGYRAGTPDIIILEPRGQSHGLFVEMKATKGGAVSPEQRAFILELRARGYTAIVCEGAAVAIAAIDAYMAGGKSPEVLK